MSTLWRWIFSIEGAVSQNVCYAVKFVHTRTSGNGRLRSPSTQDSGEFPRCHCRRANKLRTRGLAKNFRNSPDVVVIPMTCRDQGDSRIRHANCLQVRESNRFTRMRLDTRIYDDPVIKPEVN